MHTYKKVELLFSSNAYLFVSNKCPNSSVENIKNLLLNIKLSVDSSKDM